MTGSFRTGIICGLLLTVLSSFLPFPPLPKQENQVLIPYDPLPKGLYADRFSRPAQQTPEAGNINAILQMRKPRHRKTPEDTGLYDRARVQILAGYIQMLCS